jgi:transposase
VISPVALKGALLETNKKSTLNELHPKSWTPPTERGAVLMTKLSKETRIYIVQEVERGESVDSIAKKYQMDRGGIRYISKLYREHGPDNTITYAYNWTAEQKVNVLKYMHENHLSCKETGIKFGISGSATVSTWERKYLENGMSGLEDKKKGRKPRTQKPKPPKTREEELLERILYLEAENAYLKKLNALVAEREKREKEIR